MILNKRPEILSKEELTRKMKLVVALRRRTYLGGPFNTNRATKRNMYRIKKLAKREARVAREKVMAKKRPLNTWLTNQKRRHSPATVHLVERKSNG